MTGDKIDSLDDCVDGVEEPLYGFRTRVTLVEDQPCTLGVTCRGQPEGGDGFGSSFFGNFSSSPFLRRSSENAVDFTDQLLRRQTGEEFSSDAPPDCRVRFDTAASGCQG